MHFWLSLKPHILQLLPSKQQIKYSLKQKNLFNIDNNQRLASLRNFFSSSWMISFFCGSKCKFVHLINVTLDTSMINFLQWMRVKISCINVDTITTII